MQQGGNQEAEPSYVQSPNKVLTAVTRVIELTYIYWLDWQRVQGAGGSGLWRLPVLQSSRGEQVVSHCHNIV